MKCPNCGSDHHERYQRPVMTPQGGIFRRHRCLDCQRIFASVQSVLTDELAEFWENVLDLKQ